MRWLTLTLTVIIWLVVSWPANAVTILDEQFYDLSNIDTNKTTALVDLNNHWVQLPEQSLNSAITMLADSEGYFVASKNGIYLYERDDATGEVTLNLSFSVPVVDATGVGVRQDNLNIWATTQDSIAYYKVTGSGVSSDPALKTTGLVDVLSIAAFNDRDSALLLQKAADNKARITRYDAGATLSPALVFEPGITDPRNISMINKSPGFRLNTSDTSYYFAFDDATGNYVEDPARRITGLVDLMSGTGDDIGALLLTRNELAYYMNDDTGGAAKVTAYSPGPINKPVAAALRTGTFDQVFIDKDGKVYWWTLDDATGEVVRDPDMEVDGIELTIGYAHPREYASKILSSTRKYSLARITVNIDTPPGTSVNWYISSDGGFSLSSINPGEWTDVPEGNEFLVKGVLDTSDINQTPKINSIKLEINTAPDPPIINPIEGCFTTPTPTLNWTFSDADPGDYQSAYQVEIVRSSDMTPLIDSGKVLDESEFYTIPAATNPAIPNPLWESGTYKYKYRVKVWDQYDVESSWSNWGDFCIIAFERLRISEIVSPPDGQHSPVPNNPLTHLMLIKGMTVDDLAKVKAGAKVVMLIDSIGPITELEAKFPYNMYQSTVNIDSRLYPAGNDTNRWRVEFWTDPGHKNCPSGTVVEMNLKGDSLEIDVQGDVILDAPPFTDGVVVIQGSVFDDWVVVLQGRDPN